MSMREIKQVANEISMNPCMFDITMMGGEPSLYPKLAEACETFLQLSNTRNITTYTNAHKVVSLPSEVVVHCSWHPTEIDDCTFLSSVLNYTERHKVRVMMMQVPKFKERTLRLAKKLAFYNIETVPIYIVKHGRALIPSWRVPGLDRANLSYNGSMISARDLATTRTNFKGCRCHLNMYTLHAGLIHRECTDEVLGGISSTRSLRLGPIVCPKDRCAITCWQDASKELGSCT